MSLNDNVDAGREAAEVVEYIRNVQRGLESKQHYIDEIIRLLSPPPAEKPAKKFAVKAFEDCDMPYGTRYEGFKVRDVPAKYFVNYTENPFSLLAQQYVRTPEFKERLKRESDQDS